MKRLDASDVSALLSFVSELKETDDALAFPPRALEQLQRLIPADAVGYSELNPAEESSILQVWWREGRAVVVWGMDDEYLETRDLWWRLRPSHPVCGYRQRAADWTQPLKVSDFMPLRGFRRTPIYDAFYRGRLDYWLDVGLPATRTRTRVFILLRLGGRDFSERDKLVLEVLRPHLEARTAILDTATEASEALSAVEESASGDTHRVVLCSAGGTIEFASRSSRALLRRYLGLENGRLPTELLGRPTVVLADGCGRLTIRVAKSGELRVLLLDEQDERVGRLTTREREIVERVARGQTNAEIAFELGVASATVAKHLEHVYEKLDVQTRTAAVARLPS